MQDDMNLNDGKSTALALTVRRVAKPWGRVTLPPPFANGGDGSAIGEIWFESSDGSPLPLLVKYIFTSERLSVQVHPNDEQARLRGLPHGKNECWYILEAEPDSTIGIGLTRPMDREALRAAAEDGSIEGLIDWKPVRAGDFFYVPAGTVHAIGAGITLIEFQQPSETTYRLYDYGRGRDLHLEDGIAVSQLGPYVPSLHSHVGAGNARLIVSDAFSVYRVEGQSSDADALISRDRMILPLGDSVACQNVDVGLGACLFVQAGVPIGPCSGPYLLAVTGREHLA